MRKLIVINGPPDHIFSKILSERAQQEDFDIEICESHLELKIKLAKLKSGTLVLINQNEAQAMKIAKENKLWTIIICHGGEKKHFTSRLTLIDIDGNHQNFIFENWDDFICKIKNPPINLKPLLSVAK